MDKKKDFPDNFADVFQTLRSEIVWLHGRWIIFDQLFGSSQERIELLNKSAGTYFSVPQRVLLNDILISIGRLTDKPKMGNRENLSLGQLILQLDSTKYSSLISDLNLKLKDIEKFSDEIRKHRNKRLAHRDFDIALKNATPLAPITIKMIKDSLEGIREFMNLCEIYFLDSETAYELFMMTADGDILVNRLKKALAYEELEKQGEIERGYWRRKSR